MVERALAAFAVAWVLSFWHKLDPLRERLGIYHVYDNAGNVIGRDDAGGLGGWLNCPMCAAVLGFPFAWFLAPVLAPLGLALLLVRWYESLRPKAEWWR